ncbi:polysaccharide biosynthesis tyrosine autokinase [Roseiconus lacunae]|uniref:polysaccharide biosynthesis tyrosine autokinase n=1 Tax=Roseiconus lacunae TaxID=2605694 RepID=UPI001E5C2C30|nr:polysaccharide biosynthesis tyrosine autokinase [Roseiconus lacunae]MCD0459658.1 polysaccharide biosynthesis tyrosine autokinase [Roseiconus lacunae]
MFQNDSSPRSDESQLIVDANLEEQGQAVHSILWRFRYLMAACIVVGLILGHWYHGRKLAEYRATAKLMFRSDAPITLDASTGLVRGGLPSGQLLKSLINSRAIVGRVKHNNRLRQVPALEALTDRALVRLVRGGIRFQSVTDLKDSHDRLIANLSFEHSDPTVCQAVVDAVCRAIGEHFQEERESTINEFTRLINRAQDKLLPQQVALEREYQRFRREAPLQWDRHGKAVNPHRQRYDHLQSIRQGLERRERQLGTELMFVSNMKLQDKNAELVARVIGELSDEVHDLGDAPIGMAKLLNMKDDLEIQHIEIEKSLVPLKIKLEQMQMAFGASHPEVKSLTTQIEASQRRLGELNRLVHQRRREIDGDDGDPQFDTAGISADSTATDLVDTFLCGLKERLKVTQKEIKDLDAQLEAERLAADELKRFEEDEASYRRRIASVQGMLIQLEEQLAGLKLVDIEGGILVDQLWGSGGAALIGPDQKKDLLAGAIIGFILGGVLSIVLEFWSMTFRSAAEIQRALRVPVLTHIPLDIHRSKPAQTSTESSSTGLCDKIAVVHRPHSPAAEAVRAVRTAVLLERKQHGSQVFQITSPLPGDGKSTLAANVGCSIAQTGKRTLLIDLDLRSPRLSLRFNLQADKGLANVLNGEVGVSEVIHQSSIEYLDVLPCGPLPSNPAEALTMPDLVDIINWARERYDCIIIDTPPLLMVSDPSIVSSYVDAAILVMRIAHRCKPNAREALSMLRWSGAKVVGVVINKHNTRRQAYRASASGGYQTIGYGYGDKYRRRYQREVNSRETYLIKAHGSTHRIDGPEPESDLEGDHLANTPAVKSERR